MYRMVQCNAVPAWLPPTAAGYMTGHVKLIACRKLQREATDILVKLPQSVQADGDACPNCC